MFVPKSLPSKAHFSKLFQLNGYISLLSTQIKEHLLLKFIKNSNKNGVKALSTYLLALFSPHLSVSCKHRKEICVFVCFLKLYSSLPLSFMEYTLKFKEYHKITLPSSITGDATVCSGTKGTVFTHFKSCER